MCEEMKILRKKIVEEVLLLTVQIDYATGTEKKLLKAKYEGYKAVWEMTGGDMPEADA